MSPDGKVLAYRLPRGIPTPNRGREFERTLYLCEVATGKELGQFVGPEGSTVLGARFSPDGKTLAVRASGAPLILRDVATGGVRFRLAEADLPVFSPDGKVLAGIRPASTDNRQHIFYLWDAATGKELRRFEAKHGNVTHLSFSADGKTFVAEHWVRTNSGRDTHDLSKYQLTAHVWEVATGRDLGQVGATLESPANVAAPELQKVREVGALEPGFQVRISPKGKILLFPAYRKNAVAASIDKENGICLLHVATGKQLTRLEGYEVERLSVLVSPDGNTLLESGRLKGGYGTVLSAWDVSSWAREAQTLTADLSAKELDAWWEELGHHDATKAHQALCRALAAPPERVLAFLKERLRPVLASAPRRIDQLLAQLDADEFAVRDQAEQELMRREEEALPALRKALKGDLSKEARTRMERLVEKLDPGPLPSADTTRALWAVELLEQLGTPEARQLLKTLAEGSPAAWPTREAKASLERLAR